MRAEVEHLDDALIRDLDVRGLEFAVDDAELVRGLERFGDLHRDGQCFFERNRACLDAIGDWTFDELEDEGVYAAGFFDAVDRAMPGGSTTPAPGPRA